MNKYLMGTLALLTFSFHSFGGESKFLVDTAIDQLNYKRPPKGVGKAGSFIFKYANVDSDGIILNVNNVNNLFDSQIFVRPTFLGFTTKFGNYGLTLGQDSFINSVEEAQLLNSKLVLDDIQLNLSGEYLNYFSSDSNLKLKKFRVYCQRVTDLNPKAATDSPTVDMAKNCFNFLTLNGNYNNQSNDNATLEYESTDKLSGDKLFFESSVNHFDIRQTMINADLKQLKVVSNDDYFINAQNISLNCAKDPGLKSFDGDNIKKNCLKQFDLTPFKTTITDKTEKSNFNLDFKAVAVKNKMLYMTLNHGVFADPEGATALSNMIVNCKKEEETDLFEMTEVLRDCVSYTRIFIDKITNSSPDEKDSSIKNVTVNSSNGDLTAQGEVKFLGLKARVTIYGKVALKEEKKQLVIRVTDTKLPLGITSVKLLMHFLKKNLISKDISISSNVITVSL